MILSDFDIQEILSLINDKIITLNNKYKNDLSMLLYDDNCSRALITHDYCCNVQKLESIKIKLKSL